MGKELRFKFNDYVVEIDEPYEKDCGYVVIGKKDTKDNINIWFKSFNEQTVDFYIKLQKHITDLEAKLADLQAEQIKEMQEHQEVMLVADKKIKMLETKLAEKDNKLHEYMRCALEDYNDNQKEILKLKQQLTEKEKERQHLKDWLDDEIMTSVDHETFYAMQDEYEERLKQADKDKISFALEQLEKVKTNILSNITFGIESVGIMNSIDNQINVLRNNKDGIH